MNNNPLIALTNKAVLKYTPLYASMELTYVCNMHCTFCYNPVQRKGQNRTKAAPVPAEAVLSYDEIIDSLDQLKEIGALYLTLTGGEALLHPRFWDIAEEAKKRNFALRIFTNGLLINERIADRFAILRPLCIEISIHGASGKTAEALNQVPGSHEKVLHGLELLKERNLTVYLKCVVTRLIENELHEIKAIADRFGFHIYFDPVLTISDDKETYPLDLLASEEGLKRLYKPDSGLNLGTSPFERKAGDTNCKLAMGTLHIDPYGNVQPCLQWKESIGSLRRQTLRDIWYNSPRVEEIRALAYEMVQKMQERYEDYDYCTHCPGLSKLRYGDPLRIEEQYLKAGQIKKTIHSETTERER